MVVTAVVVTVQPISHLFARQFLLFSSSPPFVGTKFHPSIFFCAFLHSYYKSHPLNYFLLGLFTVTLAFPVGLTCAYTSGKVILETVILTAVVVISHTLYTFWAAWRGQDFNFLGTFLFGAIIVLLLFSVIQIFFPLGRISVMIYGDLASIMFCGYLIYDTDNLIRRYTYDEYI